MNDPNEFAYAKTFLVAELETRVRAKFIEEKRASLRFSRRLQQAGPLRALVRHEAEIWVDAHYAALFSVGREADQSIPFCVPHITSFCSHSDDMDYERRNGLLSQWRGYGKDDGFAIVFDTKKIEELLKLEFEKYVYINTHFFDVIYDRSPVKVKKDFTQVIEDMTTSYTDYVLKERRDRMLHPELFQRIAGRLKHRGFFEEREVRIIVYPVYQEYADAFKDEPKFERKGPVKPMHLDGAKPHISLFEDLDRRLPIKRIIVGPSEDQNADVARVQSLTGGNLEVRPSETPYR